jgi:hypothetical protein
MHMAVGVKKGNVRKLSISISEGSALGLMQS